MATAQIPDGTIQRILEDEKSSIRFEQFCCDLLTNVDAFDYMGTSRSWDLGRDGRSLPMNHEGECGYICCTTGDSLDAKARSDLTRMLEYAKPAKIYFCTSRPKSEHALQQIEDTIRDLAPQVQQVSAIGAHQLIPLIQRHQEPFRRRYAAELLEHADFLSQTSKDGLGNEILGMQIALATQFDDNAQVLRVQLVRRLVLRSLHPGQSRTLGAIAKSASDALRLPRIIHQEYFRDALDGLVGEGLVQDEHGIFSITEEGEKVVAADQAATAGGLDRGSTAIRSTIEALLGDPLDDASFDQLWRQLLDEFANLFFLQGLQIIQAIASLTHDEPHTATTKTFGELLDGMRRRIIRLGVGGTRADAVAQAVIDLFFERDSEALAWLTEVAVKYVNFCSLGLEPTAQQEVSGRLRDIDLVLDTDIVLSYLSEGERPHKAIEETINRWKDIGGRIVIVPPVVEEAAYHAWISEFEYQEVWRELGSLGPDELHHYVRTAFVRAFYFVADGQFQPSRWERFIGEYRGQNAQDVSKMRELLTDRGFDVLDDIDTDADFARLVCRRIYDLRGIDQTKHIPNRIADKVVRDSRILAHLKVSRSQASSRYHTTVVVSSSRILQKAAQSFSRELGEPNPVWPSGALAYLASLIPGVRLTLGVLRNCLFEEGQFDKMDKVGQFAMRVIRQSKEYSIGYSQRPTLRRALQQQIDKAALQRGQRSAEFVEEVMNQAPENREGFAEVIAEAVDTLQASKSEKEIEKLRQTIRKMSG